MDHGIDGIDDRDPFGAGVKFVCQALGHRLSCQPWVNGVVAELLAVEVPLHPGLEIAEALGPVDRVLDRTDDEPLLLDLLLTIIRLAVDTPPLGERGAGVLRAAMWLAMRHDPDSALPEVIAVLRAATPGARRSAGAWPGPEFFASVTVLVYLGPRLARAELTELLAAARDLGYHDLAPVLEWHLDHSYSVPAR